MNKIIFITLLCFISINAHSQNTTYDFDNLIAKPISYYKIWDKQVHELTFNDIGFSEAIIKWKDVVKSIKNITIICHLDYCTVNIKLKNNKIIQKNLSRKNSKYYESKKVNSDDYVFLVECISSNFCTFFLIKNDDALGICNKSVTLN